MNNIVKVAATIALLATAYFLTIFGTYYLLGMTHVN